ncbi:MAG TPA: RidA family protein [Nitrososphaeraceae archaeon]|nr:RidA family protein [Nitrososphaeraceae archaeon]
MSKNNSSGIPAKKFQSAVEEKLKALKLSLPEPIKGSPDMKMPPSWIRVRGNRAFLSGHGPQNPDGSIAGPLGKVGSSSSDEVTPESAYHAARLATLSILGTLKRQLGNLDRVTAWLMVNGFVNVAPGFIQTTAVINGCSELILELYGPEVGQHARTAMGVASTPFGVPVIIAAEVEIDNNSI